MNDQFDISVTDALPKNPLVPMQVNPSPEVDLSDPFQQHINSLNALTDKILNADHGAGSLNDWNIAAQNPVQPARQAYGRDLVRGMVADGAMSDKEFTRRTGRINGGIGTGDVAQYDDNGNITGYKAPGGSPMLTGTNAMSSDKFADTFNGGDVASTGNRNWAQTFKNTAVQATDDKGGQVNYQKMDTPNKPLPSAGLVAPDASELADKLFA